MCRMILFFTFAFLVCGRASLTPTWAIQATCVEGVISAKFFLTNPQNRSSLKDAQSVARDHGLHFVGRVGNLKNYFLVAHGASKERSSEPRDIARTTEVLQGEPRVLWVEHQRPRKMFKRNINVPPQDPLFPQQWHLKDSSSHSIDINVEGIWQEGITGKGVRIAIVDDGLQHTHPDLKDRYQADTSHNYNGGDPNNPSPNLSEDFHGTSCAGVAAGTSNNGVCGTGVAPEATLSGIRLISRAFSDADEAAALTLHYDKNFIYSNSWGPEDDGKRLEGPGRLSTLAVHDAIENGRGGKGSIYVWAGGNGGGDSDNCNYDAYASSPFTIATGAVTNLGKQAWYSEPCAALLVSAPSSGGIHGITTVDLVGGYGYSDGDCDDGFGGTSAAAPMVAGVAALILQAAPELNWKDVQRVLLETAVKVDPTDSEWTVNGAGYHINHKYGFGLVDATAAVARARDPSFVKSRGVISRTLSGAIPVHEPIPQYDPSKPDTAVISSFHLDLNETVEHVQVILSATHPVASDLEVVLTSPSGTKSILAEMRGFTESLDFKVNGIAKTSAAPAEFGILPKTPLTRDIVVGDPVLACEPITTDVTGKFVLVERGTCTFTDKALAVQKAGGVGMIVYNNQQGEAIVMGGSDHQIQIPCVMVPNELGLQIKSQLPVSATIQGAMVKDSQYLQYRSWPFATVRNWGETAAGTWTLSVADKFATNSQTVVGTSEGMFSEWELVVFHDNAALDDGAPVHTFPAPPEPTQQPLDNTFAMRVLLVMVVVGIAALALAGAQILISSCRRNREDRAAVATNPIDEANANNDFFDDGFDNDDDEISL